MYTQYHPFENQVEVQIGEVAKYVEFGKSWGHILKNLKIGHGRFCKKWGKFNIGDS